MNAPTRRQTDRLSLGVSWWVVGAVAGGFVLLLGGLAWVDRARAQDQLKELAATFCAAEVPERALAELEKLIASWPNDGGAPAEVADRFGVLHRTGQIQVFYLHEEDTWLIAPWGHLLPGRERDVPQDFATWSTTWRTGDCRTSSAPRASGHRSDLVVGRRVHTRDGHNVLLVLTARRERGWFD